ncbi:hypothetical protein CRUP_009123 [Coryphaenoides rupestris]|nr:hypothetical protein CRUP_009123 [Coryphaenoides rupestris]
MAEDSVADKMSELQVEDGKKLKAEHDALQAERAEKDSQPIKVTLPDGKVVEGESWKTTPYQVAAGISQGLADSTVIAKVNNGVWDLDRPLEGDCSLQLLKFDDEDAQAVYWHSSAHIMGEAMERVYGGCLCYGPPIESGFYYDMYLENQEGVSSNDFPGLESLCKKIIKEKQPFERLEIKKETLLDMFKNSSTYWEGKADMETLQRIYGISFPDTKMLKDWEQFQEEAKNRDHRKLGREQDLFFFHDLSPGSCFFLPKGAFIYNMLVQFIRSEYRKRGFQEVVTPNIYNSKLWQTSGPLAALQREHVLLRGGEGDLCAQTHELPWTLTSGSPRNFSGLVLRLSLKVKPNTSYTKMWASSCWKRRTRVRPVSAPDSSLRCSTPKSASRSGSSLQERGRWSNIKLVFGFTFKLNLSTRPEKFLGEPEVWDQAEKQLENSLKQFGEKWVLNPGDGAFYGPKIDIEIKDAIGRYHQCATIQLDFQLPIRFNLSFVSHDGDDKKRPVIIHRAILGSVERMIAILTENYGGKWPLWLSPRQVMVVPVGPVYDEYAQKVQQEFHVVGEKERTSDTVNVRTRDNKVHGEHSVKDCMERLLQLKSSRSRNAEEEF